MKSISLYLTLLTPTFGRPFDLIFRRPDTTSPVVIHPVTRLASLCWTWRWSQIINQPQNSPEQVAGHGDFGHLESDVAAVAHDRRADLHQLLPQHRQRPLLHFLRQSQCPHEVGEIIAQDMELKPNGVAVELAA